MITVRYFASIREKLDCGEEVLPLPAAVTDVQQLLEHLVQLHGPVWAEALTTGTVLIAVNQTVEKKTAPIRDGDEIAFFPPVTGG